MYDKPNCKLIKKRNYQVHTFEFCLKLSHEIGRWLRQLRNIVYCVDCSGKPWSYISWERDGNWNVERPHWSSSGWARDG